MNIFKLLAYLTFLSIVCLSCNKDEEMGLDEVKGTATFSVSGDASASLEYDEVEFAYSISTVSGGEITTFSLYVGNYPATETALSISLVDQGNSSGFEEQTYSFEGINSDSGVGMISIYVTEEASYSIGASSTAFNKITFTKITDTKIDGTFEVNLTNNETGAALKLTGSFEAVGEAAKI